MAKKDGALHRRIAMLEMMIANGIFYLGDGLSCKEALQELMAVPTKEGLKRSFELQRSQEEHSNGIFAEMQQRTVMYYKSPNYAGNEKESE